MTLTAEQRAQRLGKVTSSIAAGALGEHPHMTPLQAWMQCTGREDFAGNKATDRGSRLESVILDYPCDVLGLYRNDAPFKTDVIGTWAGDSADCLYFQAGNELHVGEGKTAIGWLRDEYGEEGTDEVPVHYAIQAMWHLIHWPEAKACIMPVLLSDPFEFRHYIIRRDSEIESSLIEDLARWHRDYVATDTPPPASAGDSETLRKLYPRSSGVMLLEPPTELEELAARKLEAAARKKAAEAEEEAAKNRIRQILEEHDGAEVGSYRVLYRSAKDTSYVDWRNLATALGATSDLIETYTKVKPGSRRLTVSEIKGRKQ